MKTAIRIFALFSLSLLTACTHETGSEYSNLQINEAPKLGGTAIVVRWTDGHHDSRYSSTQRVREVITGILSKTQQFTEVSINLPTTRPQASDYELLDAARKAGAKTLCVVSVNSLHWEWELDLFLIPWTSSDADYDVRLLDVESGQLILETDRDDYTNSLVYLPSDYEYKDMERGLTGLLKWYGFFNATKSTSRPTMTADSR